MKALRKIMSILLVLAIVLSAAPGVGRIYGDDRIDFAVEGLENGSIEMTEEERIKISSGFYQRPAPELDVVPGAAHMNSDTQFATADDALRHIREQMALRVLEIPVGVYMGTYEQQAAVDLIYYMYYGVFDHTGVCNQGDYLLWHVSSYGVKQGSTYYQSGYVYVTYTYTFYTDSNQEEALRHAIDEVLHDIGVDTALTAYDKFDYIYNYVTHNITYDHDHLENDPDYMLMYTAYAALMNKTAVCQGYASLLYRMLLESGLDARVIASTDHGWNIVKLGNYYYNVDSTWDAVPYSNGYYPMTYRLRCPANFPNHPRKEQYDNEEFHQAYPMASSDYDPSTMSSANYVVSVRFRGFETMNAALAWDADPLLISLLKDVSTASIAVPAGKDVSIDMSGYFLTIGAAGISIPSDSSLELSFGDVWPGNSAIPVVNHGAFKLVYSYMDCGSGGITSDGSVFIKNSQMNGRQPLYISGGDAYLRDSDLDGSNYLFGGEMLIENSGIQEYLGVGNATLFLKTGSIYALGLEGDPDDFSITMGKTGTSVTYLPEGYIWEDGGSVYVLVPIINDISVSCSVSGVSYDVDGSVVTVQSAKPLRVGYLSDGAYVAVPAVDMGNGVYSFTAPEGVEEVVMVVIGDVDGNGDVKNSDATKLKAYLKGNATLDALQLFAADVDGNGVIRNSDATKIKAVLKGTSSFSW